MSLALILAETLGRFLADVARKTGRPGVAAGIDSGTALATGTMGAIETHLASHPEEGVTVEEFRAKVESAKASALAAGDEAQARLDARKDAENNG